MRRPVLVGLLLCLFAVAPRVFAYGEAVNGFPNWSERVLLEWVNRARSDPQADLAGCPAGFCLEAACYSTASPPRYLDSNFEHSSRFHSSHMLINNYFSHPSACTLVTNIGSLYPASCDGSASCSCVGGTLTGSTDPFTRMSYFGASGNGEIIAAGYSGPDATFYAWEYEQASSSTCGFGSTNGHRYLILTNGYGQLAGGGYMPNTGQAGMYSSYATMDFGGTATTNPKIPSGSHYPQQASSVDIWVNWYDAAGPITHLVNIDGACTNLALSRGSQTNGAWHATITGVASGCHRYAFAFQDSHGQTVFYPSNGSLAIGNASAQCPDYSTTPPLSCPGFDHIFTNGFEP